MPCFLYVYGWHIRDSALLMRKNSLRDDGASGQRHSTDVALPNNVVIEKRSSRMALHSVRIAYPHCCFGCSGRHSWDISAAQNLEHDCVNMGNS